MFAGYAAGVLHGPALIWLLALAVTASQFPRGTTLRRASPMMLATVSATTIAALALGYVRFDPRWAAVFPMWAVVNLLTTCVSEEAFFRGLLQPETKAGLTRRLNSQRANAIAIAISAVLFGLAHVAGGWKYVLAATIAGGGYAFVYHFTGRLEMAILTHFLVNAVHFLLFTYPSLL